MGSSRTRTATSTGPRPTSEVHAFANDLERPVGTYLYGRRMYEVMVAWETMDLAGQTSAVQVYADIWRAADKIVYSRTLQEPIESRDAHRAQRRPRSDPRVEGTGGKRHQRRRSRPRRPGVRSRAGRRMPPLPDADRGGTWDYRALPSHIRIELELVDERRFTGGVVHLHYRTKT